MVWCATTKLRKLALWISETCFFGRRSTEFRDALTILSRAFWICRAAPCIGVLGASRRAFAIGGRYAVFAGFAVGRGKSNTRIVLVNSTCTCRGVHVAAGDLVAGGEIISNRALRGGAFTVYEDAREVSFTRGGIGMAASVRQAANGAELRGEHLVGGIGNVVRTVVSSSAIVVTIAGLPVPCGVHRHETRHAEKHGARLARDEVTVCGTVADHRISAEEYIIAGSPS